MGEEDRAMRPEQAASSTSDSPNGKSDETINLAVEKTAQPAKADMHPLSQTIFERVPFLEDVPVLGIVLKAYSPRLVSSVCLERTFAKGLAHGFMNFSIQPMLIGHLRISAATCQRIAPLYPLGWSLNSFFTVIADTFALFGYTKRWFCVLCSLGGGAVALLYARLPAEPSSGKYAGAFMFLTAMLLANVDTSSTVIYTRTVRAKPESGAAMVSWALIADIFGTALAAFVQGPLSDNEMPYVGIYIASGILFLLTLMFVFNTFGEQPNRLCRIADAKAVYDAARRAEREAQKADADLSAAHEVVLSSHEPVDDLDEETGFVEPEVPSTLWGSVELNMEVVTRNWRMIVYCSVVTAAVITTAVVATVGTTWEVLYTSIAVLVAVCAAAFGLLPPAVAKLMVFVLLKNTIYVYLPGVLKTFYLAKPECLPDGPHFSFTFFNIMNGVVGNICGILSVTVLAQYLQGFTYRGIMSLAAILIPLISLFDLIIVKRWNMHVGIPDHPVFVVGNTMLFETVNTLLNTPTMLLMSRVAPRGSESLALALLAGVTNLGSSTSAAFGHVLLETIWPIEAHGTCEYGNAPWLVISGHLVTPLLLFPLAFLLLPASHLRAKIDENGNEVSTS